MVEGIPVVDESQKPHERAQKWCMYAEFLRHSPMKAQLGQWSFASRQGSGMAVIGAAEEVVVDKTKGTVLVEVVFGEVVAVDVVVLVEVIVSEVVAVDDVVLLKVVVDDVLAVDVLVFVEVAVAVDDAVVVEVVVVRTRQLHRLPGTQRPVGRHLARVLSFS